MSGATVQRTARAPSLEIVGAKCAIVVGNGYE